jgi:hypothetical protein
MRKVNDHAREKARLRYAQQQPQTVELRGMLHTAEDRRAQKPHQHRDRTKGDHDQRDQFASTPALDQQARGNIHQQVSQEEDPCTEADHGIAKAKIRLHQKLCNAEVGSIKVSGLAEAERKTINNYKVPQLNGHILN